MIKDFWSNFDQNRVQGYEPASSPRFGEAGRQGFEGSSENKTIPALES